MYTESSNPTQVQYVPPGKLQNAPCPLVLIHDGGGTTFSYHLLGSLGRDVWAMHNPKFFSGSTMPGGIDEMAAAYVENIERAGLFGPIMLGGWSLGGYIAMAIAHRIALALQKPQDRYVAFTVAGLVLIDSPYHVPRNKITQPFSKVDRPDLPSLVDKSFANADLMLQRWALPPWIGDDSGGTERTLNYDDTSLVLQPSEVLHKSAHEGKAWTKVQIQNCQDCKEGEVSEETASAPGSPPPGVLVRCTKHAPPKMVADGSGQEPPPCLVDIHREEKLLGWEGRYPNFIRAVVDVDAHHYNMFDRKIVGQIDQVTTKLAQALEVLDALHGPRDLQPLGW